MKHYFVIFLFAFGLSTFGSAQVAQKPNAAERPLTEEDQIRFLVLSDLLGKESREKKTRCVTVDGEKKKPSKALLERLKQVHPKVKSGSRCYLDKQDGDVVVDGVTGKEALLFSVNKLKRLDRDRVELSGSNYEANMASFGCKYTLVRENGIWKIETVSDCYIS